VEKVRPQGTNLLGTHSGPLDVGRESHLHVTLRNLTAHAQTASTAEKHQHKHMMRNNLVPGIHGSLDLAVKSAGKEIGGRYVRGTSKVSAKHMHHFHSTPFNIDNLLSPNINMQVLLTVHHMFLVVLARRN